MEFCKYSKIFGIPEKGLHQYRIFNIAIVDVLATILLAFFIHYIFNFNFIYVLLLLFLAGIVAHRLFCVRTTIDKLLFQNS
jgi:hypothetical protein